MRVIRRGNKAREIWFPCGKHVFVKIITGQEATLRPATVQNAITSRKAGSIKAADLYHDVMLAGELESWIADNVLPVYVESGSPEVGSKAWGEFENKLFDLVA